MRPKWRAQPLQPNDAELNHDLIKMPGSELCAPDRHINNHFPYGDPRRYWTTNQGCTDQGSNQRDHKDKGGIATCKIVYQLSPDECCIRYSATWIRLRWWYIPWFSTRGIHPNHRWSWHGMMKAVHSNSRQRNPEIIHQQPQGTGRGIDDEL